MIRQAKFYLALVAIATLFVTDPGHADSGSIDKKDAATSPISVVVHTDRTRYSLADHMKIFALITNTSDAKIYIDRRMFWTGLSGGLALYIADEHGNHVPTQLLSDAMMPPPQPNDTSILVPLDPYFFYGTSAELLIKGYFMKPGRYSVRVIYKSMLPRDFVAPQLRDLPALWDDTPSIPSEPVWIEIAK